MSLLRDIAAGLRWMFRRKQVERELDEELRAYQEMAAEEKMKDGMSRKEALRAVRLERGSLEVSKEIVRSGGWEFFVASRAEGRTSSTGDRHPGQCCRERCDGCQRTTAARQRDHDAEALHQRSA